jgi:hypothetical protein
MDKVYVVRWGPAAGDDHSVQIFTAKASMLAFVDKLKEAQLDPTWDDLNYEVHYVGVDVAPDNVKEYELEQANLSNYSDLICFGEPPNTQIWRNGTEEHQK